MKIIVVGATGTIGSKVVEALLARHEVVGVGRGTEPKSIWRSRRPSAHCSNTFGKLML